MTPAEDREAAIKAVMAAWAEDGLPDVEDNRPVAATAVDGLVRGGFINQTSTVAQPAVAGWLERLAKETADIGDSIADMYAAVDAGPVWTMARKLLDVAYSLQASTVDQPTVTAEECQHEDCSRSRGPHGSCEDHRCGEPFSKNPSKFIGMRPCEFEANHGGRWHNNGSGRWLVDEVGVDPGPHTLGCASQTEDGGPDVCDCATGEAT